MIVFVDTSALYGLLDQDDHNHALAKQIWQRVLTNNDELVTSNYVIVESTALIQNRLGMAAVGDLHDHFLTFLTVEWVSEEIHRASMSALRVAKRRPLSLVDCSSFEICRLHSIQQVFTFDNHFAEQGFQLLTA